MSIERNCCGTFKGTPHRKTCEKFVERKAKSHQYALGFKAGLEAAVKVCRDGMDCTDNKEIKDALSMAAYLINSLPIPTNYCQNSTKLVEKQCVDKLDMSPECVEKTAGFIHKAPRLHRAGSFGE